MLRETKGEAAAEHKRKRWSEMPGWLVVTCRRSSDSLRQQEDYAACACAIQNFMLSLHSEGIASKWSTGPVTRDNEFLDLLGVDPEAEFAAGLIWYGYPAEQPETRRTDYTDSLVHHP
jgi:nitroreductase